MVNEYFLFNVTRARASNSGVLQIMFLTLSSWADTHSAKSSSGQTSTDGRYASFVILTPSVSLIPFHHVFPEGHILNLLGSPIIDAAVDGWIQDGRKELLRFAIIESGLAYWTVE